MVFRDIPNTFALEGTRPILLVSESGSCGPDRLDWTRALRPPAHVVGREERTQTINLSSGQSALQNLRSTQTMSANCSGIESEFEGG